MTDTVPGLRILGLRTSSKRGKQTSTFLTVREVTDFPDLERCKTHGHVTVLSSKTSNRGVKRAQRRELIFVMCICVSGVYYR